VNSLRAAVAAILLIAFAVAACSGGSASPSPTPSPSAEPPSGTEDLGALIPDTVGGITLQKRSMRGDEFSSSEDASAEVQEFLRTLGVSPDDVSVAIGFGLSTESGSVVAVVVFRAEGADSGRLLQSFKDATDAERETPLEWESANVGGKQVERAIDTEQDNRVYLYVNDDLLALVVTTNEEHAAEVLGGMP
jgi:hypothetical protein